VACDPSPLSVPPSLAGLLPECFAFEFFLQRFGEDSGRNIVRHRRKSGERQAVDADISAKRRRAAQRAW